MPRFTLKMLFLSVTLIAVGLGLIVGGVKAIDRYVTEITATCWLLGGTLIGAGLFAPFKHPFIGAVIFGIGSLIIVFFALVISGMVH